MMKKYICPLLASLFMMGVLVSCGDSPEQSSEIQSQENDNDSNLQSSTQQGTSSSIPPKAVATLNETATLPSFKINALEILTTFGDPFFIKKEDPVLYVCVQCTIENISSQTQPFSSYAQIHATIDGVDVKYAPTAVVFLGDGSAGTLDGKPAPGEKITGWYCANAREGAKSITLTFRDNLLSDKVASLTADIPK